jgi:hypothetical protein
MIKRRLRVVKWLSTTPAVGVCTLCSQEFKVSTSALRRTADAQASLQEQFDRHKCKPPDSSQVDARANVLLRQEPNKQKDEEEDDREKEDDDDGDTDDGLLGVTIERVRLNQDKRRLLSTAGEQSLEMNARHPKTIARRILGYALSRFLRRRAQCVSIFAG